MATPSELEVLAIEEAHRAAQARLGIAGAYLAMSEWDAVNTLNVGATGASWIQRSLRMIFAIRRKSTRLAVAYIRLARAIETGYTLEHPAFSEGKTIAMGELRQQFKDLLDEIATLDTDASETSDEDEQWLESELRRAGADPHPREDRIVFSDVTIDDQVNDWLDTAEHNNGEKVTVEDFDWGRDMTREDVNAAFQKALDDDVVAAYQKRTKAIWQDEELTGREAQAKVDKAFSTAGSTGGGRVDRYGISGGREVIDHVIAMDKRVMAWARGTRPNCCAFCALLASRGWVYKKDAGTLSQNEDGTYYQGTRKRTTRAGNKASADSFDANDIRRYHDNCHCFLIVRYVDNPMLPAQSAQWAKDYKENVAKKGIRYGNGTNNALNAWRKWLNQERRRQGTYDPKYR